MRPLLTLAVVLLAAPSSAQVRDSTLRVLTVHTPPELARTDTILGQHPTWGEQPPPGGVTARLVLVEDADGGHLGCEPPVNASEFAGQIALIERGACEFFLKAYNVDRRGAAAFIVYQDDRVPDDDCGSEVMGPGVVGKSVYIPGGFLPRCVAVALLPALEAGAVVTATLAPAYVGVAAEPEAPAATAALAVAPNPSPAAATFTLARPGRARVAVHDARGRELAVLHDGPLGAGAHALPLPRALRPGVYLLRAVGPGLDVSQAFTVAR